MTGVTCAEVYALACGTGCNVDLAYQDGKKCCCKQQLVQLSKRPLLHASTTNLRGTLFRSQLFRIGVTTATAKSPCAVSQHKFENLLSAVKTP